MRRIRLFIYITIILLLPCSVVTAFAQKQIVPKVEVNARAGVGASLTPQYVSPVVYDVGLTQ